VEEMNKTLIKNWNDVVGKVDIVLFVGDLCRAEPKKHLAALNGNIIFVRGNHDNRLEGIVDLHDSIKFRHRGIQFLFIHDPKDAPEDFEGWTICGHHHNNYPEEFPFFDRDKKRINVSVEMTDYRPVLLDDICERINITTNL
jgi:calcineurin-like phosphoesterase family protein